MDAELLNQTLPSTVKGDTWDGLTWEITSVDAEDTEFADTLTLARFQLQDDTGAAALTLTSATPGQVTINTATANAWSVTVEPRVLSLDAGSYSWGLELTDSGGVVKTRAGGFIEIIQDPVT